MSTLNDKKTNVSKLKIFLIFLAFAIPYGLPNYTQYQLSPLGAQIIEQFALTPVQFNSLFTAPMQRVCRGHRYSHPTAADDNCP